MLSAVLDKFDNVSIIYCDMFGNMYVVGIDLEHRLVQIVWHAVVFYWEKLEQRDFRHLNVIFF